MLTRVKLVSGAALIVSGALWGLAISQTSIGQTSEKAPDLPPLPVAETVSRKDERDEAKGNSNTPPVQTGRYTLVGTGGLSYALVIDTVTGRCWALYPTIAEPEPDASEQRPTGTEQKLMATEQSVVASPQAAAAATKA
jgi:hypothetical protein